MFKYFLISIIFHSTVFGSFILLKSKESIVTNNGKTQVQKKIESNIPDLEINQEKEAIMNAVSITEEELEKEISKLKKTQEDKEFENKQKYLLLEKSLELKQRELSRNEKLKLDNIRKEKEKIKKEKMELSNFQKNIKNSQNLLSKKEKELEKSLKEISIKQKEFETLINKNNLNNKDKIQEKEKEIKKQKEIIEKMNEKINQLKKKSFNDHIEQMVITDKKENKNSFLNKKSKEEIENLKKELYEYNSMIKERVLSNWEYKTKTSGISCFINIYQSKTGHIISINTEDCLSSNASEEFINSIKKATWKASPLPLPEKDSLFSRSINLYFTIK